MSLFLPLYSTMISIIIPLLNERDSLELLYAKLKAEMRKNSYKYEILFIDDGSTDDSLTLLRKIAKKDKNVRVFSFRKNQGKSEALSQGFIRARGKYVVTLDADLQDRPEEIKKLLQKSKLGIDLVCGWRKNRSDTFPKIISSWLFNTLLGFLWGLKLHDYNCGLKVYRSDAVKSLRIYGGMHRFIPLLVYQNGFSVGEITVNHSKRKFGHSKYGFSKLWKDLPDIFTMLFLTRYSKRPLHFFGTVGSILSFTGAGILLYLSFLHFQGVSIGRRPLLLLGMLLVLGGFQVFFTGFLADLIISVHHDPRLEDTKALFRYSSDVKN